MKNLSLFSLLLLTSIVILITACGEKTKKQSTKSANLDLFGEHILDFTSGDINPGDKVRIVFKEDIAEAEDLGKPYDQDILHFEPSIPGMLVWESPSMLTFEPSKLIYGQSFEATLDLRQLLDRDLLKILGSETFTFHFQTIPLQTQLVFEPLRLKKGENNKVEVELKGNMLFNATVDSTVVQKMLVLESDKNTPVVKWDHEGNRHGFMISGITRKNDYQSLVISLDPPAALGIEDEYERRFVIPAEGEFKILESQINPDNNREIIITFSDFIDNEQSLKGLVELEKSGQQPQYLVRDNNLMLIFPSNLEGEKDLFVSKNVKNISGVSLEKSYTRQLFFSTPKPAVRLLNKGSITADIESVILPIEVINLDAVDVEISKVYQNNMMQFLQYSDLSELYLPNEVSEIIWQGKIDLDAGMKSEGIEKWKSFGLDLAEFVSLEPGALYNVKVGFRKDYTNYPCESDNDKAFEEAGITQLQEMVDGRYQSIWRGWYYYTNRSWSDREDPCLPMYYTTDNFVQQNILASNLGLIAKYDDNNELFISVADLKSGAPRSGVELKIYSYQQQLIGQGVSNSEGFLTLEVGPKAFFLIAKDGNEMGYLKLNDYQTLSLSEFDISGRKQGQGVDGFIYAERGVWRPGDTMYFNFVLRDPDNEVPDDHPVSFELFDPAGKNYLSQTAVTHQGPIYSFVCSTTPGVRTGDWTAKVTVGPRIYSKSIKIETVKPNRLKIDLQFPDKEIMLGESNMALKVEWLTGLPGKGIEVEMDALLRPVRTEFSSYGSYHFDDVARPFRSTEQTIFKDKLDVNGEGNVKLEWNNKKQFPGKLNSVFKIRAYEPSGEFSTNSFSAVISPFKSYVGIDFPENSWGSPSVETGKNYEVPVIALDNTGKLIPNKKLSVGLYQAKWRWWWDDSGNEIAQFNNDKHLMAFEKTSVITDASGKATIPVEMEDYGAYLIRVCDLESGHCTGQLFYAGSYGGGDDSAKEFASMLKFKSDKPAYEIGEKATLTIPSGRDARALITLEAGGQIVAKQWVTAETEILEYEFEITKAMFPNIYAQVMVIKGLENNQNDLPVRRYGVLNLNVSDHDKMLEPVVTVPGVIKPLKEYEISIAEKQGKPMYYTLAVVDEGLLDLTRFKTPDPFGHFYARRALLTKNWDNYDDVISGGPGILDRIISIGGDDALEINNDAKKANRFVPVVEHLGPFYLEKGKNTRHSLNMVNYSGAVRVMVVAANENAYGKTEKLLRVKDDLMVLITAPRILSPGETIEMPVTVFATEPGIKEVELTLEDQTHFTLLGDRSQMLKFEQPGEQIAYFKLRSEESEGIGKINVTARARNNIARQSLEIQIENPNIYQKVSDSFALAPGESKQFSIPHVGMEGTNHAILELSKLPALGIEERISYLIRYPYGCIEQTTSAVFPQLYLDNLVELSEQREKKIKLNIISGIKRLKDFQLADHSMAYWPGSRERSEWGTAYAAHFLVDARLKGYNTFPVLPDLLKHLSDRVKSFRISTNDANEYLSIQQAYRVMVLSKAGKPQFGPMNYLFRSEELPSLARWYLSLAYSYAGKKDLARQLLKGEQEIEAYSSNSWHYGSYLRDYAVLLTAYDEIGMSTQAAQLLNKMITIYNKKDYWSTQTLAWMISSIAKRIGDDPGGLDYEINYARGKENINTDKAITSYDLGEQEIGDQRITIVNKGEKELFIKYTGFGKPIMGDEGVAAEANLNFRLNYFDEEGAPLDIATLEIGTEFKAVVEIEGKGLARKVDEIALSQIIPSGWEILNWRMEGGGNINNFLDYQDIRDDRVLSFFDLRGNKVRIEVPLHATYAGEFYLPQAFVEAMYEDDVYARKEGQWVKVVR